MMAVVLLLTAAGVVQPGAAGVERVMAETVTVAESEVTGVTVVAPFLVL
jgi:hypothetical protein